MSVAIDITDVAGTSLVNISDYKVDWILAGGFWNDLGVWVDSDIWNDEVNSAIAANITIVDTMGSAMVNITDE